MTEVGFPSRTDYQVTIESGWGVATVATVTSGTSFAVNITTNSRSLLREGGSLGPTDAILAENGDYLLTESSDFILLG